MGLTPPPDTCPEAEHLRVGWATESGVMLQWNGAGEHLDWQLAVGPAADDPEGYSTRTETATSTVVGGLRPGTRYAARVRGRCGFGFGEWSDTVQFALQDGEGVQTVADRYTQLMPNPAREAVTVVSSCVVKGVEVYALDGRKVMAQQVHGALVTLDVSALPQGTYIVNIQTYYGSTAKRLVVE